MIRHKGRDDEQRGNHAVLHPKHWAPAKGFANGIAAEGRQVFVAGQIGWNAAQQFESDDFVAQVEQALRNIVEVLAEAGARPAAPRAPHLVRHGQEANIWRGCARSARPTAA